MGIRRELRAISCVVGLFQLVAYLMSGNLVSFRIENSLGNVQCWSAWATIIQFDMFIVIQMKLY